MGLMEIILTLTIVITLCVMAAVLASLYKKVGPNEVLIVSGGGTEPIIIVGGGTVVLPIIQKKQILSLELMSIDLKDTNTFLSKQQSTYDFDGVVEVSIANDKTSIGRSAQYFADKDIREVRSIIYDIAQSRIKLLTAELSDHQLDDSSVFAGLLQTDLTNQLSAYGLKLHSVRVRELRQVKSPSSRNTTEQKKILNLPKANDEANDLSGHLAVVSREISNETAGEITYKIENLSERRVLEARLKYPGVALAVSTPVIVASVEADIAFVEAWSQSHNHYPANASSN